MVGKKEAMQEFKNMVDKLRPELIEPNSFNDLVLSRLFEKLNCLCKEFSFDPSQVVAGIFNNQPLGLKPEKKKGPVRFWDIAYLIVEYINKKYNIDVFKKSRKREILYPRYISFYLMEKHANLGSSHIGRIFSMDHTSVIHGLQTLKNLIWQDLPLSTNLKEDEDYFIKWKESSFKDIIESKNESKCLLTDGPEIAEETGKLTKESTKTPTKTTLNMESPPRFTVRSLGAARN